MVKKITYKVEKDVDLDAMEDVINKYASKGWILDQVLLWQDFVAIIFRDK